MAVSPWMQPQTASWAGSTNPNNAFAVDGQYVSVSATGGGETPYMRLYNYTNIAANVAAAYGPVPRGFEFRFTGYRSTGTQDYDYTSPASWPGGSPNAVNALGIGLGTSPGGSVIVGGPTQLFGGKVGGTAWQWSDLDSSFGPGGAWAGNATWLIDCVEFRFYYDDPPSGGAQKYWWGGWSGW